MSARPHRIRRRISDDDRDIISGRYSDRLGLQSEIRRRRRREYRKKRNRRTTPPSSYESNSVGSTVNTTTNSIGIGRRIPGGGFYNRRRNRIRSIRTKEARNFGGLRKKIGGKPVRKLKKKQQTEERKGRRHDRIVKEPQEIKIDRKMKGKIDPI